MLMLRSPEFGNQFRVDTNLVVHRTAGGQLRSQSRPNMPKFESFVVSFIGLTKDQIDSFIQFATQTRGLEIGMTDFESRNWLGYITNDKIDVRVARDLCNYETSFTFEGVIQ